MRKPACAEDLARVVPDLVEVGGALDEDVGDREGVVEGERGVVAARADLLGPDLARDVDQQAAAVALAVDVAGAVEHLLEGEVSASAIGSWLGVASLRTDA